VPAYLKSVGNPFNLTPWTRLVRGHAAYTYYFVLPDLLACSAATSSASHRLQACDDPRFGAYAGHRLHDGTALQGPRPIPAALAVATLPFLFDASFTIDGGNLFLRCGGVRVRALARAESLDDRSLRARRAHRSGLLAGRDLAQRHARAHILPWFWTIEAVIVVVIFELLQRRGIGDPI